MIRSASNYSSNKALQATQQQGSSRPSDDTISTITDQIVGDVERRLASIQLPTAIQASTREERVHTAKNRDPRAYRNLNEGKGKRFSSYCFHCGVNCTHWTKRCLELSANDKQKYRDADFDNRMGGSTKFLDRKGKYQSDFNFDSL